MLVVNRADGPTICVVYSLTNSQEVDFGVGDGTGGPSGILRRADLLEPDGTGIVGNISGQEKRLLNADGSLRSFHWVADFQVLSQTGGAFVNYFDSSHAGQHTPMSLRGRFKVHRAPFVPGAPGAP